jgi:hypothetical protein
MLCLVRIKSCQRCGGDVSLECDIYGVYAECIQCGATWYQKAPKVKFISNAEPSLPTQKTKQSLITGPQD